MNTHTWINKNGHNTVYEIGDLSHWTAGHWGQWCPRDGTQQGEQLPQLYCQSNFRKRRRTCTEPSGLHDVRSWRWMTGKIRQLEVGLSTRGEKATQTELNSKPTSTYVRKWPKLRKEPRERGLFAPHLGPAKVGCTLQPAWFMGRGQSKYWGTLWYTFK